MERAAARVAYEKWLHPDAADKDIAIAVAGAIADERREQERQKARIVEGCDGGPIDQMDAVFDELIRQVKEKCKAHPDKPGC